MGSSVSALVTSAGPWTHQGKPLALALHRLAAQAHDKGLVILDDVGAAPFACRVSSSRAGHPPHFVDLTPGADPGCTCEGYARHQRCQHYCLALDVAGWLPDVELVGEGAASAAPAPISIMPRSDRRAAAAADLATRHGQAVAS